jgi:uncharacterized protein
MVAALVGYAALSGALRMNRYQLAKIVQWAGTFRSRKRMQKLIFMLQAAGCPLDAEYELHPYGPYSDDVARVIGELVCAGLLVETSEPHLGGELYSYTLSADASRQIAECESGPRGVESPREMAAFHSLALKLYGTDVKELEFAATVVFYRMRGADLTAAVEKACRSKSPLPSMQFLERCRALAAEIVDRSGRTMSVKFDLPGGSFRTVPNVSLMTGSRRCQSRLSSVTSLIGCRKP